MSEIPTKHRASSAGPRLRRAVELPPPRSHRALAIGFAASGAVTVFTTSFMAAALLAGGGRGPVHPHTYALAAAPAAVAPVVVQVHAPRDAITHAPVIHDGGLRVVLETDVDPRWLAGPPRVTDDDGMTVATRPLTPRGAQRFATARGDELALYSATGLTCRARVGELAGVGRFSAWDVPVANAAEAWESAELDGAIVVAAALEPLEGDCRGALWARTAALPRPDLAGIASAPEALDGLAVAALRATDDYADLAGDYAPGNVGTDAAYDVLIARSDTETLAVATALLEGCAGPEPALTVVFAVAADGSLRRVSPAGMAPVVELAAAADTDGDGDLELFVRDDTFDLAVLRAGRIEQEVDVPIHGCRC